MVRAPPLSLALPSTCQDQAPCGQPPDSSLTLAPIPSWTQQALKKEPRSPEAGGGSWAIALWGMEPQGHRGGSALGTVSNEHPGPGARADSPGASLARKA